MISLFRFNLRTPMLLALTGALLLHLGFHASAATNCAPITSGVLSVWTGQATFADTINTNNGISVGPVTFTPAKVGSGFLFDNSYVSVADSQSLQFTNDFTIELWFQDLGQKTFEAVGLIAKRPYHGACNFGINMYAHAGGRIQVYYLDPTYGSYQVSIIDVVPTVGQFHHLAAVYKQVNAEQIQIKTFFDGELLKSDTFPGNLSRTSNNSPITIGCSNPAGEFFYGVLDEVTLFQRALADEEIASIYGAGSSGKCLGEISPGIMSQPDDQLVRLGARATFNVLATGSTPLYYQWLHNSSAVEGATTASLVITNVQQTDIGSYSVIVSNSAGWLESSNALLTIISTPSNCVPSPAGIVGLWRADGNPFDSVNVNNGSISGNVQYDPGMVNQAFAFDGNAGGVTIGNPTALRLQNFTIECWIKRSSPSQVSSTSEATIFSYGIGGYGLGMFGDGRLYLTKNGYDNVSSAAQVTDTGWHHIAVSKVQGSVIFYVDGEAFSAPAYSSVFGFSSSATIGSTGGHTFLGAIDELAVYNRALSPSEILVIWSAGEQGKCAESFPPAILTQPSNRTVAAGASTTFSLDYTGTQPLSFQWRFNDSDLVTETNSSLSLNNIQLSQAGNYSVVITNNSGAVTSAWAALTVTLPTPVFQIVSTNVALGNMVSVPITLRANGNENGLGFSVSFATSQLTFVEARNGSDALGATVIVNTNYLPSGKVGVALSLNPGSTFPAGTTTVLVLTFMTKFSSSPGMTYLSFSDTPVTRQLFDASAKAIPASFQGGTISLLPGQLEADVLPRPNGDRKVLINDWIQIGRYAARLDSPTNSAEFQRADCAPRETAGNGKIGITDWVQAGRYAANIDPLAPLGGPDSEVTALASISAALESDPDLPCRLEIRDALVFSQAGVADIFLISEGDVNALGFSLSWDPAKLTYAETSLGSAAPGAPSPYVNTSLLASGKLGIAIGLQPGTAFAAGTQHVARIQLRSVGTSEGSTQVVFGNQPVPREVSDLFAKTLSTEYTAASVAVNPTPALAIHLTGSNVQISWPAWSTNYTLQRASGPDATEWDENPDQGTISGEKATVTISPGGGATFFRLKHN